jgi:hypothetical protein
MKRIALITACMGFALAASAQQAAPQDVADAPREPASAPVADTPAASDDRQEAKDRIADRNCLRHTGSRLIDRTRGERKCAMASGRAYSREDLDRTGSTDLADALRRLDPAIH